MGLLCSCSWDKKRRGQCPALESSSSKGHTAENGHSIKKWNWQPEPQGVRSRLTITKDGQWSAGGQQHPTWLRIRTTHGDLSARFRTGESLTTQQEPCWSHGDKSQIRKRWVHCRSAYGRGARGTGRAWARRGWRTQAGRGRAGAAQSRAQAVHPAVSHTAAPSAGPILLHAGLRVPAQMAALP